MPSLLKKNAILFWPFPVGWLVGFAIYASSVEWIATGFPDEEFWWGEAVFVAIFVGSICAAPLTGMICVFQFLKYANRKISSQND